MGYLIDLDGQVAIVTGAAQGIGGAIAKKLAQSGAQVVINDVCEPEKAQEMLGNARRWASVPSIKNVIFRTKPLFGR